MEENTLACVGSVTLLLVKNDTLCNWFLKKKKKERENASLLCKGLRLHRTIRSQILSCSTSVRLFMNLSLTLFLTGRTRTVFFFPAWVKKKKKGELWFFANSWRETICFNGAGSVIFTLTKGRFSALRDRSCCCSSDVLMGFTGLWHWGHSLNHLCQAGACPRANSRAEAQRA